MESLFEQLGGTYRRVGDYYIPDLVLDEEEEKPIGIWGQRHERWLKREHRALYHNLMFTGKLHDHLAEVDERAEQMAFSLINEIARSEGVTEALKSTDQLAWIRKMNGIRARVEEIVYNEAIYTL